MKLAIQYAVTMHNDEGELIADAQATLNATSVEALVAAIVSTAMKIDATITKANAHDKSMVATHIANELYSTLAGKPHVKQ